MEDTDHCIQHQFRNEQSVGGTEADEEAEDSALFYSDLMPMLVDVESTVGMEAFVRLAPSLPQLADIITVHTQFEELTSSIGGRLPFPVYDKYVEEVDKAIRTVKSLKTPSLVAALNLEKEEMVVETNGTKQPVIKHVGVSASPGRLSLTDRALYFEEIGLVSYEKPQKFDLAADLDHSVKPELSGPLGARLFDRAIVYNCMVSEPVVFEFPELTGHTRRDYWLAIVQEIILVHKFIWGNQLKGLSAKEALSRAILGICRLQATREVLGLLPQMPERFFTSSSAEHLPGGDFILEALADYLIKVQSEAQIAIDKLEMHESLGLCTLLAVSALSFYECPELEKSGRDPIAKVSVGDLTSLEKAVLQARNESKKIEFARATIEQVRLEGIGKNIQVFQELVKPFFSFAKWLQSTLNWKQPLKTTLFGLALSYIIYRNWLGYLLSLILVLCAGWMLWVRHKYSGSKDNEVAIPPPPQQSTLEQVVKLQKTLSQIEESIQKANVALLKLRALVLGVQPEATNKVTLILLGLAVVLAIVPLRVLFLIAFWSALPSNLEIRRRSSERFNRRLREWWHSIPVVSVCFLKPEDKKL